MKSYICAIFLGLCFLFILTTAAFAADGYPRIDVSGFKKYEYTKMSVNPERNLVTARTYLGYLQPALGISGPWYERLQLKIKAELSERLSAEMNLQQEPDLPEKYDVTVKYDNHTLTFGDFNVDIKGNEFASMQKYVNGAMFQSFDRWYDMTLVSAKVKSETQKWTEITGNNTRGPFSMGHGYIVESSEKVEINGVAQVRDKDYLIDYFDGKITFTNILSATDKIRFTYEFTSIIDLFFPTVSKRNLVGAQARFTIDKYSFSGYQITSEALVVKEGQEIFPDEKALKDTGLPSQIVYSSGIYNNKAISVLLINGEVVGWFYSTDKDPDPKERAGLVARRLSQLISEGAKGSDIELGTVDQDYVAKAKYKLIFTISNQETGGNQFLSRRTAVEFINRIRLSLNAPIYEKLAVPVEAPDITQMKITESIPIPIVPIETEDTLEWQRVGVYNLRAKPMEMFSEKVMLGDTLLKKDDDYSVNYKDGVLTLLTPMLPTPEQKLTITYKYYDTSENSENINGKDSRGPYTLSQKKIIDGSEKIFIDGKEQVRDLEYNIGYEDGRITFNNKVGIASTITAKYKYVATLKPQDIKLPPSPYTVVAGATYLSESAKAGTGGLTATVIESWSPSGTKRTADIINNSNTAYLTNFPLDQTSTITVKQNNNTLTTGVDYAIPTVEADVDGKAVVIPAATLQYLDEKDNLDLSDGYDTGTIKFLTTLNTNDEITIIYTYSKSIINETSGSGNGSEGPYYLGTTYQMVPGSEVVQIYQEGTNDVQILKRNSSPTNINGDYYMNYSNTP
ncbi:MAG: hypothetical protein V1843_00840, partial [bacterium]